MTNKEIARKFNRLGELMELHEENTFKIRSYKNAYLALRKLPDPLTEMSDAEIGGLKGIGKAISGKIRELLDNGEMAKLNEFKEKTPEGVQELMNIKGLGAKKIRQLWQEMDITSVGELFYACNENRLIALKGFGLKTQEDVLQKIEYYRQSRDKFLYASLEAEAEQLVNDLHTKLNVQTALTGAIRRKSPILRGIEILVAQETLPDTLFDGEWLNLTEKTLGYYRAKTAKQTPVRLYITSPENWGTRLFNTTGTKDFNAAFGAVEKAATEAVIFEKASLPPIPPEMREDEYSIELAKAGKLPTLITKEDIKGVIHSHTTYSDGINTLREMAEYARDAGYTYIAISDHSKSAFYANGLKEDRVLAQMEEIDALNKELAPFRIFKSIESDILNDGSLDYDDDMLSQFDLVIASVHSNLKMDENKATQRLLTAIANPFTTILGHPTGRLLLSRKGYPIDHKQVIEACAEHHVAIELNANPLRLDMDWTWIPYALERGVKIAINPDAHSTKGIHDIHFGVCAARKGGLSPNECINCLDVEDLIKWVGKS